MDSSASTVVHAWEFAAGVPGWQRPAALLSALSGLPLNEALQLGIARRDAALVAWRTTLFGAQWPAFAQCPACQTMLEYDLPQSSAPLAEGGDSLHIKVNGQRLHATWPTSVDLAEAAACPSMEEGRRLLLERMLPEAVPEELVGPVLAALAEAHHGFLSIDLRCPECSHQWASAFDAGEYLWREVRAAGRRTLRAVDTLARAYGWSEAEVLALSDMRRNEYLAMVQ